MIEALRILLGERNPFTPQALAHNVRGVRDDRGA